MFQMGETFYSKPWISAHFAESLSSCTQGTMLSSNLRKHPWDFQPPLETELQQETTNTPGN